MIDWDKRNYPKELDGVPFRYVGKNVKLYKNGRVFVASRNKIIEKKPRYNDRYFAIGATIVSLTVAVSMIWDRRNGK